MTLAEIETVMKAIRTLDDVGRFSENLDFVVMAGEARNAFERISKREHMFKCLSCGEENYVETT